MDYYVLPSREQKRVLFLRNYLPRNEVGADCWSPLSPLVVTLSLTAALSRANLLFDLGPAQAGNIV